MAPRERMSGGRSMADDYEPDLTSVITEETHTAKRPPMKIVWRNVVAFAILHLASLYGVFLLPQAKLATIIWTVILYVFSAVGITAGAHRLWAHRSYKARLPLRILLCLFNTVALQNDLYEWARDHRSHHKYSESDADPHNAKRGFFFSHMGWLLVRKHPDVIAKGGQIDLSDIMSDPVVAFQRRFYKPLVILCCFILPAVIPWYAWNESLVTAYFISSLLRYCSVLHATWCVNSVAHIWGMRPYDASINPVENLKVSLMACGEGFHNFHHVFPQDYQTGEFGWHFNFTTSFIDFMALIGQAYSRKKTPEHIILKRRERTGDLRPQVTGNSSIDKSQ